MNIDVNQLMDDWIKDCKEKKTEQEEICFALGVGRVIPMFGKRKEMKQAMEYIKSLDGFIGINPVDRWHNLLIFDTINNAKGARNGLKAKNCPVGQIAPVLVKKEYIELAYKTKGET